MKLSEVLDLTNQIEKTAFFKLLDQFCGEAEGGKSARIVDQILSDANGNIKNIDNDNIEKLFLHFEEKYSAYIHKTLEMSTDHLDVLIEIMIRDGNGMMSREWFGRLYDKDLKRVKASVRAFKGRLKEADEEISLGAKERDYLIYRNCLQTAYDNDALRNRERHVSFDEKTILNTLARGLKLSNQEVRSIRYTVLELKPLDLDDAIRKLKDIGVVFVHRKTNTLFIPDEFVWLIRKIYGLDLPNKFLRRILKNLSDSELNRVARQYSIDWKQDRKVKIQAILEEGLSVNQLLTTDIFQSTTSRSDRRDRIQELMEKDLGLELPKYGRSLEQKVETLLLHFHDLERDGSVSLSLDGYAELLRDLAKAFPKLHRTIRESFEIQAENAMDCEILNQHGITPRDVLYLLTKEELKSYRKEHQISNRGNAVALIIERYRNVDDLLFENIELVGARDLQGLTDKGLSLKESEVGRVYEKLVSQAFTKLGLIVDEPLRNKIRTSRLEIDLLVNLGGDSVMIVECKTVKSKIYDKYSAVKRQLLSYETLCQNAGLTVRHHIVISNSFSEDFISDCEYDDELNLSLLSSRGVLRVVEAFEQSSRDSFPVKVLQKAGLLNEERIAKVLNR